MVHGRASDGIVLSTASPEAAAECPSGRTPVPWARRCRWATAPRNHGSRHESIQVFKLSTSRAVRSPRLRPVSPGPQHGPRHGHVLRVALPFVQKILPLLDGNIGTAVSNILTPHPPPPPQHPPVDLAPH